MSDKLQLLRKLQTLAEHPATPAAERSMAKRKITLLLGKFPPPTPATPKPKPPKPPRKTKREVRQQAERELAKLRRANQYGGRW